MENNIPTANEFFNTINRLHDCTKEYVMIEFAKLHVEAALKVASENSCAEMETEMNGDRYPVVIKDSILNAYPLTLIK